jgi:capsular exopolysaccharide synthesis family protein
MAAPGKGGSYYYGSGSRSSGKKKTGSYAAGKQPPKQPVLMGDGISFAASEAYKLLRTKLQFSFSDENESHVIGVSSALSGEGKSLSAVNLAHTLCQLNKRVVLIDCDMRRPTLAEKLNIQKKPGLSSLLTGQKNLAQILQRCEFRHGEEAFYVISAGQNPPNPIELLSSNRMAKMLEMLRQEFDYIIIDLPPVGEVSDAMAVAKQTDGMLLVVRQNYCDRVVLTEAVLGGNEGMHILPPLFMHDMSPNGVEKALSARAQAIYDTGRF